MASARKTVFMSYAHQNRKWTDELIRFLAPWIRDNRLTLWDDSKIKPGISWELEIEGAIKEATVAVLLVGVWKHFLCNATRSLQARKSVQSAGRTLG